MLNSNETPAVDVRDLRMRYGTKDVLAGVTFSAQRARCWPCSGRTARERRPRSRSSKVSGHGRPVMCPSSDRSRTSRRSMAGADGVVLQSWRDHRFWRVRELLAYQARFYAPFATAEVARPWDVDELIDVVGLSTSAHAKIMTLSAGSASARRGDRNRRPPGDRFLDEPTAGFDPHARRDFRDLAHRLSDFENTTILMTTHDLDEAEKIADRIRCSTRGGSSPTAVPTSSPASSRPPPKCTGPPVDDATCTLRARATRATRPRPADQEPGRHRARSAPRESRGHLHGTRRAGRVGPIARRQARRDRPNTSEIQP